MTFPSFLRVHQVWLIAACLGFWVFPGQPREAAAVTFYRGGWEARENDEGKLLQSYLHQLGLNLDQSLTERLAAREKVTYNYGRAQGSEVKETVSPGASLLLSGHVFEASLAVNSVTSLKAQTTQGDTDTLGLSWGSRWEKKLLPEFRASYDANRSWAEAGNSDNDTLGGNINWDLLLAKLFYSYQRQEIRTAVYENLQESHLASIKASRIWMGNRLQVSLGHDYSENSSEQRVSFSSGTVALPLNLTEVRTGTDALPDDSDDSTLASTFTLRDGNLLVAAYGVAAGSSNNNLLLVTNGQQVSNLYLYTQNNLGANPLGLTWRVYSNDLLLTTWNQEAAPAVTYDTINQRFVLVLPAISAAYLKVVVDLDVTAPAIGFTEMVIEQVLQGAIGSTSSAVVTVGTGKSTFGFDFRLNQMVGLFYAYLADESSRNKVTISENENHNGGVRLKNASGDLRATLTGSLTRGKQSGLESEQKSYQLWVSKAFLPTLSGALTGSHSVASVAGETSSIGDSYSLYADAKLYPDLDSRLELLYAEDEDFLVGGGSSSGERLSAKVLFTSRFRPSLSVSVNNFYEVNSRDGNSLVKQNTASLNATWRLSESLMLYGNAQSLDSKLVHDVYGYSVGCALGLAAGVELTVNYALQKAQTKSQSGTAALRANTNKHLFWEIGGSYAETEAVTVQNVYKVYSQVQLQFTTR